MEKTKFYIQIHYLNTDEVREILVPRGDIKLGIKYVAKHTPENVDTVLIRQLRTKPQPDDNNESYRITTVRELKKGTYFRVVRSDGTVGKNVFVRGDYDFSIDRYSCMYYADINAERNFKSNQRVCIDFTF